MFEGRRPSAVEYLVFALALVLLLVLGYQGARRGLPDLIARLRGAAPEPAHYRSLGSNQSAPTASLAPGAVDFVGAVKVVPGGGGRKKPVSVPAPPPR